MEVIFTPRALEDREYWKRTGNKRIMKRITDLLEDVIIITLMTDFLYK